MKKNGDFFWLAGITTAFVVFVLFNNRKIFDDKKQPKVDFIQYSNRLVEFFEKEKLPNAFEKFQAYLDMGIVPSEAFDMIVGSLL